MSQQPVHDVAVCDVRFRAEAEIFLEGVSNPVTLSHLVSSGASKDDFTCCRVWDRFFVGYLAPTEICPYALEDVEIYQRCEWEKRHPEVAWKDIPKVFPFATYLDRYRHSYDVWAISPAKHFPDYSWDVAPRVGVWAPAETTVDAIYAQALYEAQSKRQEGEEEIPQPGEDIKTFFARQTWLSEEERQTHLRSVADSFCRQALVWYNAMMSGDVWCAVVDVFSLFGDLVYTQTVDEVYTFEEAKSTQAQLLADVITQYREAL